MMTKYREETEKGRNQRSSQVKYWELDFWHNGPGLIINGAAVRRGRRQTEGETESGY